MSVQYLFDKFQCFSKASGLIAIFQKVQCIVEGSQLKYNKR